MKLGVARVHNNPMIQLVSSTLITAGTKILGVGIANLSAAASYVHLCDEAAATGNISITSYFALGVAASDTVYQDLPAPYVCVSGTSVKMNTSNMTTFIFYEA
jgi:hypothetical protein